MGNIILPFAQFLFGPFLIIIVNFETNKVDKINKIKICPFQSVRLMIKVTNLGLPYVLLKALRM